MPLFEAVLLNELLASLSNAAAIHIAIYQAAIISAHRHGCYRDGVMAHQIARPEHLCTFNSEQLFMATLTDV
jgi:hypothetical protein